MARHVAERLEELYSLATEMINSAEAIGNVFVFQ